MPTIAAIKKPLIKPKAVKPLYIKEKVTKVTTAKTSKRPARRVSLANEISRFQGGVNKLPKSQQKIATRNLMQKLEARQRYIQTNIEKINRNLNRYRFQRENIEFLKRSRLQELQRTNKNQYKIWDLAEKNLVAGQRPADLLRAGYTVSEVAAGVFKLKTKK